MADDIVDALDEGPPGDPSAAVALALTGASRAKADTFLERQSRYLELQMEDLHEQRDLTLSHLRWRRLNDWMRAALQIVALLVGIAVVIALGATVWSASQARGLVILALKAPPDLAAKGLDGTALAERLLDKLNALIAESDTVSYRSADTIRGDWGDDSRVEIPETSISVAEFYRALRNWLGSETHVSGGVWRSSKGIALAVRVGANVGVTVHGPEDDLDALLDRAAESVLRQTQPYRCAALLQQRGRFPELIAYVSRIARTGATADRTWSYQFWSNTLSVLGRNHEALALAQKAIALDPSDPANRFTLGGILIFLGHQRDVLRNIRPLDELLANPPGIAPAALAGMRAINAEAQCVDLGDFACASSAARQMAETNWYGYNDYVDLLVASNEARGHDARAAMSLLASHPEWTDTTAIQQSANNDLQLPFFFVAAERGVWPRAVADLSAADRATRSGPSVTDIRHTYVWPWLAYALARSGRMEAAAGLVNATPLDCDLCLSMRGRISALGRDRAASDYWFDRATRDAPDWPFAPDYWGEALLERGDIDGAIAKFVLAHQKGPHYADPLELWGEALVAKNRSDLALDKFAEAARYAPNWGRLHLKWGEALLWLGRKDEAKAQFAIASHLDLAAADRAALERLGTPAGNRGGRSAR